jgi:hypothetical protein
MTQNTHLNFVAFYCSKSLVTYLFVFSKSKMLIFDFPYFMGTCTSVHSSLCCCHLNLSISLDFISIFHDLLSISHDFSIQLMDVNGIFTPYPFLFLWIYLFLISAHIINFWVVMKKTHMVKV